MSKFNTPAKDKNVVLNHMGGKSFKQSEKEELTFAVIASFLENSYYDSKDERIERISELVEELKDDPTFIAKLAIVTRKEFHMRSAFHVLIGELTKVHRGDSLVKNTIREGTERPDDLLEIAAYVGKPMPNQVKKGIREAIHKFNQYQLAKYKGSDKDFSLVDLFNLVRPKPENKEETEVYKKLVVNSGADKLEAPETWEVRLSSEEGRKDKGAVWKDLVLNKKIGYMALLRNLRNIGEQADDKTVLEAIKQIIDPVLIRNSKQLPFRFLSAYQELEGKKSGIVFEKDMDRFEALANAVQAALEISIQNIPTLPGRTVILSDNSGSMRGDSGGSSAVSAMSKRTSADIANLFATLYWSKAEDTLLGLFGDTLQIPKLDRKASLFENFDFVNKVGGRVGGGTETGIFSMFENLIREKTIVDRIIIFSDCQVGTGCNWYDTSGKLRGSDFNRIFQEYRKINPNVLTYSVDLRGHGNTLFSDGVVQLAGWSDKIFELMETVEREEGLVKWIEEYPVTL